MTTFTRQRVAVIHSQQPWNQYAGGGIGQPDSEQAWMRKLAEILAYKLTKAGHIAYLSPQGSSYADNVRWVNAGQFDQVISCHSNATGREGDEPKGAGVYYVSDGGKRMAVPIAARLGKIVPGGSYLSTSLSVAELTQTRPPAILIEHHFHDWAGGAAWIRANLDTMAQADCDGFCDAFGRLAETPPPIVSPGQNPAILLGVANCQSYDGDRSAAAWDARGRLMASQRRNAWAVTETTEAGRKALLAALGANWKVWTLDGLSVAVLFDGGVFSWRPIRKAGPRTPFGHGSLAVPLYHRLGQFGADVIAHHTRPASIATDAQKDADIAAGAALAGKWPAIFAGDFARNTPKLPDWIRVTPKVDTMDAAGEQSVDAAFIRGRLRASSARLIDPGALSDHKWLRVDLTPGADPSL